MVEVKYYCDFCGAEITVDEHGSNHVGVRELVDGVQQENCKSACATCLAEAKAAIDALVQES